MATLIVPAPTKVGVIILHYNQYGVQLDVEMKGAKTARITTYAGSETFPLTTDP